MIPPPDIKAAADKIAEFVARNNIETERKIQLEKIDDVKFGFFMPWNVYYPYYQDCLRCERARLERERCKQAAKELFMAQMEESARLEFEAEHFGEDVAHSGKFILLS